MWCSSASSEELLHPDKSTNPQKHSRWKAVFVFIVLFVSTDSVTCKITKYKFFIVDCPTIIPVDNLFSAVLLCLYLSLEPTFEQN